MKKVNLCSLYNPPTLNLNYLFRLLKSLKITNLDKIDLNELEKLLEKSIKLTYKRKLLLLKIKELKNGNN